MQNSENSGIETVVKISNLSKSYSLLPKNIFELGKILLKHKDKNNTDDKLFWALKDINFEIFKGETFGIIGRNGAGKSTLLKLIAGVIEPTTGSIFKKGQIQAMLELGAGFNPELTGVENIYFYGSILGLTRSEIDKLFNAIVEFAEIGEHINHPIKTYSSGMVVRLAFAVQSFFYPDILIIDEALSVGDIFFAQKCFKRLKDLQARGTTIIFVSHDVASVRNLCNRALYLKSGKIAAIGDLKDVIIEYYKEGGIYNSTNSNSDDSLTKLAPTKLSIDKIEKIKNKTLISSDKINNELFELISIGFCDKDFNFFPKIIMGDTVNFYITLKAKKDVSNFVFTLFIRNKQDQIIFCGGPYNKFEKYIDAKTDQINCYSIETSLNIEAGQYTFEYILGYPFDNVVNRGEQIFFTPRIPFEIAWEYENDKAPFFGMFGLNFSTNIYDANKL